MNFKIYTLGCKVNTYESNVMKELLEKNGYIETDSNPDIIVINTCTVTNMSDRKSMKMIHHAVKEADGGVVIVVGCSSQVNADRIKNTDGVSIVLGNKYKSQIVDLLNEFLKTGKQIVKVDDIMDSEFEEMKLNNFNRTRAFVKIEDGCNNFCAFCIIPYSRGGVRSKDMLDVLDEIKTLVKNGHHEVVLTGIHTGHYGSDLQDVTFADLLSAILKIDGLQRLRISSIEMNEITSEVLELFKNNKVLVDHMHIPLQSGSDKVLKDMNRKYNKQEFKNKIEQIRKIRPNMSITTDLIVGFPTETEEEFLETMKTLKEINFSKIHVFPYSERKGTVSSTMKDLNGTIKKDRVHKVLELSKKLEIDYMSKFIGKTVEFIPEVYKDGYLIGHTGNYLSVKALGCDNLLNNSVLVKLESIDYPYMVGIIINDES